MTQGLVSDLSQAAPEQHLHLLIKVPAPGRLRARLLKNINSSGQLLTGAPDAP